MRYWTNPPHTDDKAPAEAGQVEARGDNQFPNLEFFAAESLAEGAEVSLEVYVGESALRISVDGQLAQEVLRSAQARNASVATFVVEALRRAARTEPG